ncbi:MAG: hypothetical protein ACRD1X_22160 [Vicinamibacteria bacterium]
MANDEANGVPARYESKAAARRAANGAVWEHAWAWWIVCIDEHLGTTVWYGPDVEVEPPGA